MGIAHPPAEGKSLPLEGKVSPQATDEVESVPTAHHASSLFTIHFSLFTTANGGNQSLPLWVREACAAVVNDMPVAYQSRGGTEPQRDRWLAQRDERGLRAPRLPSKRGQAVFSFPCCINKGGERQKMTNGGISQ